MNSEPESGADYPTLKTWSEADRVAALESYAILDTPVEAEFDDIVRLAAETFAAPIAVVNLVSNDRQWFKSEVGIGARELPLDVSICAHAILQNDFLVVPDTRKDRRFDCNPLVTPEDGLRFYAGAILRSIEGLPIGTVCVLDREPRPEGITAHQRLVLEVLARQVMTQLELRKAIVLQKSRAEELRGEVQQRTVAEAALAMNDERLRLATQAAEVGFWDVDVMRDILTWPPIVKRMFGISADVPVSMVDFYNGLHPDDRPATGDAYAAASDPDRRALYDVEYRTIGKEDGLVRWVAAKGRGMFDADGRCLRVIGTAIDVTERKRAEVQLRELNEHLEQRVAEAVAEREQIEEALRQSQKMEAVGQLTGGIAHDFNNMLAVVIGSLDLLGRRLGAGDPSSKRYVDAAMDGAQRAATLTQRLLAFSRQQPLDPEVLDANKLVPGMSELLRHSLGADIRLETVLAAGSWRTHADRNQLENAILNLAVNARDAMPGGGRLTIETQNTHIDERYTNANFGVPPGQYVMIAVSDSGSGMPPEVIAKAFDPFFTTKQVGKGTGLGLSQVYGFVKQSGGHVKIYSEIGQGTTIKIYLPRYVGEDVEVEIEPSGDLPRGERQEVVLVVEDEPAVRHFSVDALTELGYRVLEADGAAAALRLLDAHPEIVLLFTDIVMPDVNGRKLVDEAHRRRPDLKVLFTTGYTRNAVVHNGVVDPGVELIGKPFTVEQLATKVRAVLES